MQHLKASAKLLVQDLKTSEELLLDLKASAESGNPDAEGAAGAENEDNVQCNICLWDHISLRDANVQWKRLSCGHLFCAGCVHGTEAMPDGTKGMPGFLQKENPTCPTCREPLEATTQRVIL